MMYAICFTEKYFTKNLPDKLKMTVKGGAAVDPDSGKTMFCCLQGSRCVHNKVLKEESCLSMDIHLKKLETSQIVM